MAQTVQLNVSIKTRDGVRALKQLKGTIQDVRDQVKNFKTDTIAREFQNINKVIDMTNMKLDKFSKNLDGKRLSLMFGKGGDLLGSRVGGSSGGAGANNLQDSGARLVSIFNQLQKSISNVIKTINLANLSISRSSMGGGGFRGGVLAGGSSGSSGGFRDAAGQVLGGLGFSVVDVATQLRSVFADRRVKNAFSDGASQLFSLLGGIFGQSIASIAGDIGKAFGEIAEVAFNALTLKFRVLGLALSAAVKGIGIALGLSLFGGFSLLTGGLGIAAAGIIAVFTGVLGAITSIIKELFEEALDVLQSLFKAAFSIITATIKTVITVFESVAKIASTVWMGLWEGIKGVTKASVEGVKEIIGGLSKVFFNVSNKGLKDYAELQKGIIRGNKEIVDTAGRIPDQFADITRDISSEFGKSTADINELFFSAASRGILRRSGANAAKDFRKFTTEVARAAQADFAQLNNVGNATISVLENFGLGVKDVTRVTQLLNRTTTLGATNMDELSVALANVLPSAANLGFGLEDTLAAVARITQVLGPGKAKNATRILNRFFEGIAIPTDRARKRLEQLGVRFDEIFDKSGRAKPGGLNELFTQISKLRAGLADGS